MSENGKTSVLCVVGPTASGKSALAMRLAKALDGEIVSMDSMQIYRGMDVGTAKPSQAEQAEVRHHMLDVVSPDEPFTVSQYAQMAEPILHDIRRRGKKPLLVGGTGFYLRAIADGLALGGAKGDETIRSRLEEHAAQPDGKLALHERLQMIDPETAARLHENDVRRVIRALEVYELTGKPFSRQEQPAVERPFRFCMLGATMPREQLYGRINGRVDDMLKRGLLDEVRGLLTRGVAPGAQSMQGIGYKELLPVLLSGASLTEAVELLKRNTRHYAKRQWTWFRAEQRVQWLDMTDASSADGALRIAEEFFAKEIEED